MFSSNGSYITRIMVGSKIHGGVSIYQQCTVFNTILPVLAKRNIYEWLLVARLLLEIYPIWSVFCALVPNHFLCLSIGLGSSIILVVWPIWCHG